MGNKKEIKAPTLGKITATYSSMKEIDKASGAIARLGKSILRVSRPLGKVDLDSCNVDLHFVFSMEPQGNQKSPIVIANNGIANSLTCNVWYGNKVFNGKKSDHAQILAEISLALARAVYQKLGLKHSGKQGIKFIRSFVGQLFAPLNIIENDNKASVRPNDIMKKLAETDTKVIKDLEILLALPVSEGYEVKTKKGGSGKSKIRLICSMDCRFNKLGILRFDAEQLDLLETAIGKSCGLCKCDFVDVATYENKPKKVNKTRNAKKKQLVSVK